MRRSIPCCDAPVVPARGAALRAPLACGLSLLLSILAAAPAPAQKMPALGPKVGSAVGDLPIDFTLKDLDGRSHSLKEVRQQKKVILVVFWASWCAPCVQEVPLIREAYAKYHERGLEVFGIVVNLNQSREGARSTAQSLKINYPVLWDEDGSIMDRYRVTAIPHNFLIGRDGLIRFAGTSLPRDPDSLFESLLQESGETKTAARIDGAQGAH